MLQKEANMEYYAEKKEDEIKDKEKRRQEAFAKGQIPTHENQIKNHKSPVTNHKSQIT